MATSKANLLGKRKPEDCLEAGPVLKKHKEVSEEKETTKEQIEGRVDLLETKSDEANSISVKETVEGDLETEPVLKKPKEKSEEEKETTKEQIKGTVESLERKSDEANLISVKDTDETPDFLGDTAETVEGLNVTPIIPEESAVSKKTLFVSRLPPHSEILDIIDFFQDVGQVVRVRLQLSRKDKYTGQGFVEFASSNQAKKALEKKKGEYLHNREIRLDVANKGARCLPPKYCIDHKIWYEEDYLQQQESLPIKEDETPRNIAKAVDTLRSKTLFIANLSPQTTKISHIIDFFGDIAEVDSVRLIVNHKGKHVGYGFVEFASPYGANKALEYMNGEYLHDHRIFLMKGLDETPDFAEAVAIVRNKTLFIAGLSRRTKISDIIHFFKDVGQVVHVRLIVDRNSRHVGFGFVEFSSANEAAKALEKKNGEYLNNYEIFLDVVKAPPYPERSKYCIDHKVWYEDYSQRESLLIEEDAAVELDKTPDIVEIQKRTVFVAALAMKKDNFCYISKIIKWSKSVGEVVRVRMIGDDRGELLGCGFVEFASAKEAKKAVQEKNGFSSYVKVAETYAYPFRPKYNIPDLAKKLWYEDNLRREGFGLPKPKLVKHATFCGEKTIFQG